MSRMGRPPVVLDREQEREMSRVLSAANRVEAAEERLEVAKRALREAALDAVDADVPQLRVIEAASIGRMTLWRWLQADESEGE
jgi:hypothetical protein